MNPAHNPSAENAVPLARPAPRDPEADRQLMLGLRAFAKPDDRLSSWQVASTLLLTLVVFAAIALVQPFAAKFLLFVPLAAMLIRLFVLQHDCGHLSLFTDKRICDRVGLLLSIVTGVAYEAWRTEHNWHHSHQGKLSHRGVDRMNSPMTVDEAAQSPEKAVLRVRKIGVMSVFVLGALSLAIQRKHHSFFFQFRPNFRWEVPNREQLIRSVRVTNLLHAAFHGLLIALLGPWAWTMLVLPAYFCASGLGSLLFWVQHNFEHTYHADGEAWTFVEAGLHGASYLRLPGIMKWVTASIGVHHVHHLNVLVPNYRLEAARADIPQLAAIAPLGRSDLARCFTHVFWDAEARRLVKLPGTSPES